jgi:hypothetical protein
MSIFDIATYSIKIKAIIRYLQKYLNMVAEALILIAYMAVAYIVLSYFAKYMWYLFMSTSVGQAYAEQFFYSYQMTNNVLNKNIIALSFYTTAISFVICFVISAICQFLLISRYLYEGRGFFSKLFFFGLPLTYIVAFFIRYTTVFNQMNISFRIALIPTMCIFMGCFRLSGKLLPELVDIINKNDKTNSNGDRYN